MVTPEQAAWKSLTHWVIALACAVEPAPSSWPEAPVQAMLLAAVAEPPAAGLPLELELVLLSEPHAASVSELTTARAPMARALVRPLRWSFTWCPFPGSAAAGR